MIVMSRMTLNTRIILEPVNVIATSCHDVGYHVTFIIVLSLQHYTCKLHHMSHFIGDEEKRENLGRRE